MTTPSDIVRQCLNAYVEDDRGAIEAVIADDFAFTSPLDNRLDRATYFDRCWANHRAIHGFRIVRMIEQGETVIVTYEGEATGKTFRNTEVLTVRDGKIAEVEVYFGWNLPHTAPPGGFID